MVPWNVSPGFAVSLESRSVIRTWSLVPGGSVAFAADIGSAPARAIRVRTAHRYRQFIEFLRCPADKGQSYGKQQGSRKLPDARGILTHRKDRFRDNRAHKRSWPQKSRSSEGPVPNESC